MTKTLLNPKSSEIGRFFICCLILVLYLGHGSFQPVAVVYFSKLVFWRGLELPS